MTFVDLEFKAEDINNLLVLITCPKPRDEIGEGSFTNEEMAGYLNSILKERLEKAPRIFWRDGVKMHFDGNEKDTHRARLVCIEEIRK